MSGNLWSDDNPKESKTTEAILFIILAIIGITLWGYLISLI